MSGPKRKREEINGDSPRKKKAGTHSHPERLKFSIVEPGDWKPAIVFTPGLQAPSTKSLEVYTKPAKSQEDDGEEQEESLEILMHSSDHPRLDYTIREDEGRDGLLRDCIAVYDPKTGAVQVMPAKAMVMRSTLRSTASATDSAAKNEDEEKPDNAFGLRTILGEAFGTKKSQNAIKSKVENAIVSAGKGQGGTDAPKLDAAAEAVLGAMAEISTRQEQQLLTDDSKPRPNMNLEATAPEEVFSLEDLVGTEIMPTLNIEPWQEAARDKTDVKTTSRFVSQRLNAAASSKNPRKAKALLFFLALLQWTQCLKSAGKEGKKLPPRPVIRENVTGVEHIVIESIRKRFAPENELNKRAVDYLYMHICALALVIENLVVDIHDLEEDLGLERKQLTQYYQELGCKITPPTEKDLKKRKIPKPAASFHKMAKLRLPLEFPKTRLPPRRTRR